MIPFRKTARGLFLSVAGALTKSLSPGIHILNGHGLSVRDSYADASVFLSLLGKLRQVGEFVRIEDAASEVIRGNVRDGVYIAFTFDDGYQECHTHIAPALAQHGTNAAFFINPGFVFGDEVYRNEFFRTRVPDMAKRPPMTKAMLRELATAGFIIGAHTHDHIRLVGLSRDDIQQQIVDCRLEVEAITGVACDYFAWTYGKYADIDARALDTALATYRYVFSSDRYYEATSIAGRVINRRHFECDWPFRHVKYFLARNRISLIPPK